MPNMPRCDLRLVAYRLPIELAVKVSKAAKARGIAEKVLVTEALTTATENVELTSDDMQMILEEVRQNEQKRKK